MLLVAPFLGCRQLNPEAPLLNTSFLLLITKEKLRKFQLWWQHFLLEGSKPEVWGSLAGLFKDSPCPSTSTPGSTPNPPKGRASLHAWRSGPLWPVISTCQSIRIPPTTIFSLLSVCLSFHFKGGMDIYVNLYSLSQNKFVLKLIRGLNLMLIPSS